MISKGRIYLVEDDELIITMLSRALKNEGYETRIQTTVEDVVENIAAWHPALVMLDIHLNEALSGLDILEAIRNEKIDTEVVMLTGDDTAESAIRAMKLGAADYLTKPFNIEEVKIVIRHILDGVRMKEEIDYLRKTGQGGQQMICEAPAMRKMLQQAKIIAEAQVQTILLTGESGSGKEVMAQYLHNVRHPQPVAGAGADAYAPFISVNCTALPENLIESELFGHTKGAFTDAKSEKKGFFELASGGTLLLDEIGDMRHELQAKLLRVLEERKIRRVGGTVDLPVNLTLIASTNRDIKAAVAEGKFREDLFFRLSAFSLHLPPLRERREDILLLANYFLDLFAKRYQKNNVKAFAGDAERLLVSHHWPGNIRELRNVIERCVVLEDSATITAGHLPLEIAGEAVAQSFVERRKISRLILPDEGFSLDEMEKDLIVQALTRTNFNQTKASRMLGVSYDTLRYQMKKYGLKK
jgi:DNA-binding NtrC family response regulator